MSNTSYKKNTNSDSKVVEFEDINQIKRKSVRGLLRKRAKKYECKVDGGIYIVYS
jgi:hypothetical protein